MLGAAVEAARTAGRIQRERFQTHFGVRHKGALDLVTDVDLACEEAIREVLTRLAPGTAILGEEAGLTGSGSDRWIVDPLDGTTNYAHGYPAFCVSIAWEAEDAVRSAVVYDPLRDELFACERGLGTSRNGEKIRVSAVADLSGSLLATGFPYDRRDNQRNNLAAFCRLTMATLGVRRSGSAALDLAYVAAARLDGFWEPGLKPWDQAAGALLVREAGGTVTAFRGSPFSPYEPEVVATNGLVHEALLAELNALP